MGEFKPRNPDTDLLYRGEKKIADSIKSNAKAIKDIDLSQVNVEVNTENISDAILESATANTDALEGVAGAIQNVQRYIDYTEKLEEIVNAISALNYGEELQGEIYEIQNEIKEIIENYEKLKSDYEETTEETLGDITLLNKNYENLLLNLTNLTETVNNIIEKIGDIPADVSDELADIKTQLEDLRTKIANIPDNVEEKLSEIESKIENIPDNVSEELEKIEEKIENLNNIYFYTVTIKENLYLGVVDAADYVKVPNGDYVGEIVFDIKNIPFQFENVKQVSVSGYLLLDGKTIFPIIAQEFTRADNGISINLYFDCLDNYVSTYVDTDFTFYITYTKEE